MYEESIADDVVPLDVPPRRGQKVKKTLLPSFNQGNVFEIVRERETGRFGLVSHRTGSCLHVWFEFDMKTTEVDERGVIAKTLKAVPSCAYSEIDAVIGGVGKHKRWKVVMNMSSKKKTQTSLRVTVPPHRRDEFEDFVSKYVRPFGLCRFEFDGDETVVEVPDSTNIGIVAGALHGCDFETSAPPDMVCKLSLERYDRSEHMWWNQKQLEAGPLRDMHRWVFDFLPPSWPTIPFTWQSMCENITLDPLTESCHIPRPLRDYYLTKHIDDASAACDYDRTRSLERLRGPPAVTCRLTTGQNRQLLCSAYWNLVAPLDAEVCHVARLVRFRYMIFGYTAREIGAYNQNALNLGHGARIRSFRNKPQYDRKNLSNDILNKIYRADGQLAGSGFKGTRGKYGHEGFPKYTPKSRMKRNKMHEDKMRSSVKNVFEEYRRV